MMSSDWLAAIHVQLIHAAKNGDLKIVQACIKQGAHVNVDIGSKQTPLYFAVLNNHLEIVKYLVEHGADVNAENNYEMPLHMAVNHNYFEIMKCLVEHGAHVNAENYLKQTPLYLTGTAMFDVYLEMIKYLVEHGADVNVEDQWAQTLLHMHARYGHLEVVKYLVEHGADVNAKNQYGATAYNLAVQEYYYDVATYLRNAKNYFDHGIKVVSTQYNKHLLPNYCALAFIKHDMAEILSIFDVLVKRKAMPHLKYYLKFSHLVKAYDIEKELLALYFSLFHQRPKTRIEHEAVMQLINLQPGNTISISFNDMYFRFE